MKNKYKYLVILLLLILGILGNLYFIGPGSIMNWDNRLQTTENYIPKLQGTNLVGEDISFPDDFKTPLNFLVIGFKREHQKEIDTWIQVYNQKKFVQQKIDFFELPIIYEVGILKRLFINNGMKMGISDPTQRQRTVTIYMKRQNLFEALTMKEETIYSLLVDQNGKILWRSEGMASPEKIESLESVINNYDSR